MQALIVSTGVVALAEVGDKTQLPAFILAAWFREPLPIIAGNLCATVINHGLAGALGAWITSAVNSLWLRWVLGNLNGWTWQNPTYRSVSPTPTSDPELLVDTFRSGRSLQHPVRWKRPFATSRRSQGPARLYG